MSNYKRIYIVICVNEHRYQALFGSFLTSTIKDIKQAWIKNSVELIGTSIYGIRWVPKFEKYKYNPLFIRKYTHGAKLMPHLDHMETHVISAILNIAQKVTNHKSVKIINLKRSRNLGPFRFWTTMAITTISTSSREKWKVSQIGHLLIKDDLFRFGTSLLVLCMHVAGLWMDQRLKTCLSITCQGGSIFS